MLRCQSGSANLSRASGGVVDILRMARDSGDSRSISAVRLLNESVLLKAVSTFSMALLRACTKVAGANLTNQYFRVAARAIKGG